MLKNKLHPQNVTSVNGRTGKVVLDANDIGALPAIKTTNDYLITGNIHAGDILRVGQLISLGDDDVIITSDYTSLTSGGDTYDIKLGIRTPIKIHDGDNYTEVVSIDYDYDNKGATIELNPNNILTPNSIVSKEYVDKAIKEAIEKLMK